MNIDTINLLQRITGLTAFALIFIQIVLGSNMDYWKSKFGTWPLKIHTTNGLIAYTFIFLHPLLMVLYVYSYSSNFDPFYVYTDVCLLCDGTYEYYINFGRLAFLSATVAVTAGLFRGANLWMRQNWRKLHILNYFAFYFVSIHSYNVGTDSATNIFQFLFWMAQIVVAGSILKNFKRIKGYYISTDREK